MRLWIWLLAMLILGVSVTALSFNTPSDEKTTIWHMPAAYPVNNYQTQTAQSFADNVAACTNDQLNIVIHANGSLFKGHEIKRAVRTGQVAIGERLLSAHSNENQMFAVDSIPFIASSFEEAHLLWDVARPAMEDLLASENMVLLYSVIWPPQGIYFGHDVTSIEQVRGYKFRAYNAATARVGELAGMIPVQIEAAEMSQALATGVVKSFMASGSSGYDSKVWEHISHYYDAKAWLPRNFVFANKDMFDALPPNVQSCLRTSAQQAEEAGNARAVEMTTWYIEQLKENGMTVIPPGPQFRKELAEIGETLANEWVEYTGPTGRKIFDDFLELKAKP